MSKKDIVHISARYSIGCTFLDWSLHWLSGESDVLTINSKKPTPLVENPITNEIAHGHAKNHPWGIDGTTKVLNYLENSDYNGLITIYWLGNKPTHVLKSFEEWEKNTKIETPKEFSKVWKELGERGIPGIWIDFTGPKMFLDCARTVKSPYGVDVESREESLRQWVDLHFPYSLNGIDNPQIWDYREAYALCVRPYEKWDFGCDLDFSYPNYNFNMLDWVYNGRYHIEKIMEFLDKPIDKSRWDHWCEVYEEWASRLRKVIDFANNAEKIVKDIVNNVDYEIGDMTINQEGIIQHILIYKHDLNVKTWQLEKFPTNCRDIHKLLEPNIHNVEDIYDCRKT